MITIEIPSPLRPCCDGATELSVEATTVRELLVSLEQEFPELYRSVCNETGAVREHMNLFVNSHLLKTPRGLDRGLSTGDVIHIFQAVSGG